MPWSEFELPTRTCQKEMNENIPTLRYKEELIEREGGYETTGTCTKRNSGRFGLSQGFNASSHSLGDDGQIDEPNRNRFSSTLML